MSFDDTDRGSFNVIVASIKVANGVFQHHGRTINHIPLSWGAACKRVEGLLRQALRGWDSSQLVDVYIEPVACRRPWTPQILAMYEREDVRGTIAMPNWAKKNPVCETGLVGVIN